MRAAAATVSLVLLPLAGCAAPPAARLPEPPPALRPLAPTAEPLPTTFTAGARRFSIDLSAALTLAGGGSFEVALARARTNEMAARALRLEQVFLPVPGVFGSFRGHDGRVQRSTGQFVDDVDKQQFFGGVGGIFHVDIATSIFEALAGERRADASIEALAATRNDMLLEAARGYFELVGRTAVVDVAREVLAESREFLRERDAYFARGAGLRVDVLRGRAEVAQNEQRLTEAEAAVREASVRLATVLGLDPQVVLVPIETRPAAVSFVHDAPEAALVDEALAQRPEIREAEALVTAANHESSAVTWGPLVPGVLADTSWGGLGPHPSDFKETQDLGVFVGWRFGPGGILDIGAMREAGARADEARIELARRRQRVTGEVIDARVRERAARARLASAIDGVVAADEALRLSRERVRQGVAIALEFLDAQRIAARSRLEEVQATVALDEAAYALLRAIGEPPPESIR
jgi:outer membrane protein TolC